jgi:hypothetical protein
VRCCRDGWLTIATAHNHEQMFADRYSAGMIDFQNGLFVKLGPSNPKEIAAELAPILVEGEAVYLSFRGMRDSVVFTNK